MTLGLGIPSDVPREGMFPGTHLHILAVDDEPTVLEVLATCLRAEGHSIEICNSGSDALSRFVAGAWDLVITDRSMPGMDGFQLARAIKQMAPSTPVVLMTGMTAAIPMNEGSPVDAVLTKPFTMASLRQMLSNLAGIQKAPSTTSAVFN